ncbi:MAG TPA: DUF4330 domain-containing protein [Clostridia bacterium]|nr:DUF4330 domain-containing protein [Clostridia bacterium]
MKIVDQKGKLFGLINIIDLCVLLIIVLLAGVVGYKFLGKEIGSIEEGESQELIVTTKAYGIRTTTLQDSLKEGHPQLVSLTKTVDAYIESVTTEQADDKVTTSDGRNIKTKDPLRVDVTIKFKMHANSKDTTLKLGNQDVAIGKGFEVKTRDTDIITVVSDIQEVK